MTSQVGPEDTLRMVATTFGFQNLFNDKAGLLASFEKFIIEKAREGRRLLLIVDEAQNLPKQSLEELRMLTNLDANGSPVFQVFLVGQSELQRTINSADMEQLKQRIVSTFQLVPLDLEETREYILFRLQTAGWKGTPEFAPGVFELIHEFTAGIPRRINTLCDRFLLFGYLEELGLLDEENLQKVIAEVKEELLMENRNGPANDVGATVQNALYAETGSLDERMTKLEQAMLKLENSVNKEKALLRKAILLHLDMDAVYNENSSME